jgi:alpha-L-fucosidase
MKTPKFIALAMIILISTGTLVIINACQETSTHDKIQFEPTWESLMQHEATPQWYQDAVLGFYFHWGPYSVPSFFCWGYWTMYVPGSDAYNLVKEKYGEPGIEWGYKDFVPLWKAPNYNPDDWAALFKYAGADFAGPGAEHHDGFALWDTEFDEWNSYDMGPGIDIVGTLVEAIRKQGMKTSVAVHFWRTWITYDTGRRLCPPGVDVNDPQYEGLYEAVHEPTHRRPIDNKYPGADWPEEYWAERVNKWKEIVDKYKVDLIWCEHMDSGEPPDQYKREMLAYYFNAAQKWGEEVVVTSKKLWETRRQDLPPAISPINREIGVLNQPRPQKWQTDIPLGKTWSYSPDVGCKPVKELVELIVNNVSKNGIAFFSVAPKPDGSLPEAQVEGLTKLGDWMAINKEALYATVPASFDMSGTNKWQDGSMRFLRKQEYLYVVDLEKPVAPLVLPDVWPLKGSEIYMLGYDKPLKWYVDAEDNVVIEQVPDPLPCDYAWSFKIQVLDKSW